MTTPSIILVLLIVGIVLAVPMAIGISAALGFIIVTVHRWSTPCPKCGAHKLSGVDFIRETYPTGKGTGTFYRCENCHHRAFWSNDDRGWRDANAQEFDDYYTHAL
jgi:hypothetical protein